MRSMMKEQKQNIRDKRLYKFSSSKRYLKIHVPDFAFKHDDNNIGKDKFVGRELQIRKLFTWLTSDSKSGSYLITGYRGMGKSLLVKRVIDMISREPKAYKEVLFQFAMILTLAACFISIVLDKWSLSAIIGIPVLIAILILETSKKINLIIFEHNVRRVPFSNIFNKDMIAKVWLKNRDRRNRRYSNIAITVNLGQEVLNERDVLSLIAHSIREKYYKFVHNRQNRPITSFLFILISSIISFSITEYLFVPIIKDAIPIIIHFFTFSNSWVSSVVLSAVEFIDRIIIHNSIEYTILDALIFILLYCWTVNILKKIRKKIPRFSVPYNSLDRLESLCERVASSLNEENGIHPQYSSSFFNFSFGKAGKSKSTPIATVRELEQELMGIVNDINGDDCPISYQAQFIIVFDELDKIANIHKKGILDPSDDEEETTPSYEASLRGFTEAMPYEQRKQNVLRLLANMKLFITSVKAKCVFISGYELFDASLADLSDREFAISSIFNGVLNVTSFLSPEREEADVSSMTEVYLATMLLPEAVLKDKLYNIEDIGLLHRFYRHAIIKINERLAKIISFWPIYRSESYLKKKVEDNIKNNGILKDELPSLRWYNQYLMEVHILNNEETLSEDEIREREQEIQHTMGFLRNFCIYLSHISNGSPKKIATYFEKYVRVNYDTIKQFDWYDEIEVGLPTEDNVRSQCVLYFDPEAQKLINFIHFIAAPVMNAITNEVSHYGDKLLVSSSFILDQIYKYHGKGFSWRNLEQMPELLNTNKNPELRDALASIMEFLLQTHVTTISSSIFQYKFHKQIAEEISMLSKTSEEAAAIFNFTLNESETVKRYNIRLLWNYMTLTNQTKDKDQKERYCSILERLHENQGDIYFSEEDYYRAIHEYRSALQYIDDKNISAKNLIPYLKCSLKIGMSYEYRHTFENAYMVYCQIINKLINLRWMEESDFGLDYTMRLTHDWRIKQTVLVNSESLDEYNKKYNNYELRRHFNPGLVETITCKPFFSFDSDKTISSLSKNFTPEKSDVLLRLTAFEDIKFIYQAIIAKLFAIEKMESIGITQSSIDAAEAEFITLYGTVNHNEKYILAVDFFSKLASILYYKNAIVTSNKDLYQSESIYTTLYLYDMDIFALIDDYCYYNSYYKDINAIEIKDNIYKDLYKIKTKDIVERFNQPNPTDLKDLILNNKSENHNTLYDYLLFLDDKKCFDISKKWNKLIGCYDRRNKILKEGHKLPCTSCKYVNRSIDILMSQLFDYYDNDGMSKTITLLRHSSHNTISSLRPEILFQLASTAEQLADILMSCGYTTIKHKKVDKEDKSCKTMHWDYDGDSISVETIELLISLANQKVINEDERKEAINNYSNNQPNSRNQPNGNNINKALLYYWAAFRYYDIASLHHEAIHCIWRIICVIENYLSILVDIKSRNSIDLPEFFKPDKNHNYYNIDKLTLLFQLLYTQATRIVSRQHDNYDSVEIHELKWLFHKELMDDLDLSGLTLFPNLQSLFISITNCKILIFQLVPDYTIKKWEIGDTSNGSNSYVFKGYCYGKDDITVENDWKKKKVLDAIDYLSLMYEWVSTYRHERTFKSNVELNFLKAKLNHLIFNNILDWADKEKKFFNGEENITNFYTEFYRHLRKIYDYNSNKPHCKNSSENRYVKYLFKIKDNTIQSKLDLLDYIIYDSIVCLSNIINAIPPHNQFTTFSSSFVANVYEELWTWAKYYEVMFNMYSYYRYFMACDEEKMNRMIMRFIKTTSRSKTLLEKYANMLKQNNVVCKDDFGYRYSKLFMNIRHDVDDSTIHHIFLNYSAEMAIKYYRAARGINSEGLEYKNLINNMYILDDDLRNDTCQSNLADERYVNNSGVIDLKRKALLKLYSNSRANRLYSYENNDNQTVSYPLLYERYEDSKYTNTDY